MSGRTKGAVHLITMGCAKNVVDSERLAAQLRANNITIASTIDDADVAVVNTCGFIDAAKQESIEAIITQVRRKGRGRLKKVYAMGCLTERYRVDLTREIPEVDRFFGSNQLEDILHELGGDLRLDLLGERILSTPPHTAYLKISEGCDNPCSFCAIPLMRGRHVSKPMDLLLQEASTLASRGVKELVVIGQDTTYYGLDLYGKRRLADLLQAIADINGIEWVRLMYAYPAKFPLEVLDVIAGHPRLCKYLDMPLQHIADPVLRSMRRGISSRALRDLIDRIRDRVPGIALRTTVIAGYPAEGPLEFQELLDFISHYRFERLGVFTYSHEEGTGAYALEDCVPPEEKERRMGAIMEVQREISAGHNDTLIGKSIRVLIEREENGLYVGRTEHDAPDIDNEAYVSSVVPIIPGTMCSAVVDDAVEYDLYATAGTADASCKSQRAGGA